jgi:hypothetical protein
MDKARKNNSNQIVSHVYSILDQNLGSPIILKWEKEQRSGNANTVSNELELTKDPGNKNEQDEPNINITDNITLARKRSESPGTNNMHMTEGSICRTSNRQKKCPVTKSEDYFMVTANTDNMHKRNKNYTDTSTVHIKSSTKT